MPNAVEMKQRGLICRQVLQGSALLCCSILLQSFVAHAGSQQHLHCKHVSKSPSRGRGWCATSDPSLGYRGAVKGDLSDGFVPQSGQGKPGGECSHRWVWMGKKDLQLPPITWLRAFHAGESCVDGKTALQIP